MNYLLVVTRTQDGQNNVVYKERTIRTKRRGLFGRTIIHDTEQKTFYPQMFLFTFWPEPEKYPIKKIQEIAESVYKNAPSIILKEEVTKYLMALRHTSATSIISHYSTEEDVRDKWSIPCMSHTSIKYYGDQIVKKFIDEMECTVILGPGCDEIWPDAKEGQKVYEEIAIKRS